MTNISPLAQRYGVRPLDASDSQGPASRRPGRKSARPPLIDLLPVTVPFFCGATAIEVPNLTSFSGAGVFGVARARVQDLAAGDAAVMGMEFSVGPCDPDGSGVKTPTQSWGDKFSNTAAILVGVNLPFHEGQWADVPAVPVPGIFDAATNHVVSGEYGRYLHVQRWAGGSQADTVPARLPVPVRFAPFVNRVQGADVLVVALAFRGSDLANSSGSASYVNVALDVTIHLAETAQRTAFRD